MSQLTLPREFNECLLNIWIDFGNKIQIECISECADLMKMICKLKNVGEGNLKNK